MTDESQTDSLPSKFWHRFRLLQRLRYWFNDRPSGLDQLWKHYLPLARGDVLVASLMINLLSLALPMLTLQIYDRIIPNRAMETLVILVIALIVAVILDVILKTARAWLAGWTGARYEHDAGCKAMDRMLASRLEDMEDVPAGIHLDRMTSVEQVRDFYASQASLALIDLPFVVVFLSLMAFIAGWLALVPIILIIIGGYVALKIGARLKDVLSERLVWDDRRFNFLIEALAGVHTIKSMSMEPLIERRYERLMQSSVETGFHVTYLSGLAQSVGSTLGQIGMISVVGIGSLMVMDQSLSIGGLAACILLSGRSIQPILKALSLWTKFQQVTIAEAKLAGVDTMPLEGNDGEMYEDLASVELIDAAYAYSENTPVVLKGLNFSIRPGEIVGITGGNGSGKSTFLHMLMGRLSPTEGAFLINGHDSGDFSLDCKSDQIAYLPQRPVLLKGTVLDNLTMFDSDNFDMAMKLAEQLGLDQVFAHLPDGYETKVGDTAGSAMPAGVVQRIAIARALVGNPKLILFDEANAMLDGRSDPLVRSTLESFSKEAAIVIISYRPSLLNLAQRRYVLKGGALVPLSVRRISDKGEKS